MTIFNKPKQKIQTKIKDYQQVKIRYEIIETKATPFAGLYVLSEFLNKIKFHKLFNSALGKLRQIRFYHPVDSIATLLASI